MNKYQFSTLLSIIISTTTFSIAQQSVQKTPDGKYVGKCEVVATNMKSCKKCDDEKLTKNCKDVICDDYGQCAELHIKSTSVKAIKSASAETKIKGILKEKTTDGQTQYYLQEGNYRTYIFRTKDGYNLTEYDISKADKNIIMTKPLTPAQISCIDKCSRSLNYCLEHEAHLSDNGEALCRSEAEFCAREICLKYAKRFTLQLPLTPTTKATLKNF